jgi:predicted site-specific integrase-resolvase
MNEKPLRIGEVARLVGVDIVTVRRWCQAGKGPRYFRTPQGSYRFPAEQARKWAASIINGEGVGR